MSVKGKAARNASSKEKNPNMKIHEKLTIISNKIVPRMTEVKNEYLDFEILLKTSPVIAAAPVPAT